MADSHQNKANPNRETGPERIIGPDGTIRTVAQEDQLNKIFAACFRSPAGHEVLGYLRSITINTVVGPEASDAALRHKEGMRFLFGVIDARINAGHSSLARVVEQEKQS